MFSILRPLCALCHVVGYLALAVCHWREPVCVCYGLLLIGAALPLLKRRQR